MALPHLVPKPKSHSRYEDVDSIVRNTLAKYREVLNSDVDLRSIRIDVKLTKNGRGVRAAVINLEGEVQSGRDDS